MHHHHHYHRHPASQSISLIQPLPDPTPPSTPPPSSWPLSFFLFTFSFLTYVALLPVSLLRGMLGGEGGLEYREDRERRERVAVCCSRQSACVLGWADGGSGWHLGGTGTSAGRHETPQRSFLSLLFLALFECLLPTLSAHPQRRVNQHNLSSALGARGRQRYGSGV